MRKIRIILGFVIPDIGGIIIASVPMAIFLSLTNFFAGSASSLHLLVLALILLISLSLFIFPFKLILIIAQMLKIELDKCGILSIAITGGLVGGSLFYFMILSHFSVNWSNFLDYALLGVLQSLVTHIIYIFIPGEWKVRPAE
jgi:hypothetical protein